MIGMVEMGDGRVMVAMHEGYRVPGYIRGQFFRVTPEGADSGGMTLSQHHPMIHCIRLKCIQEM